MVAIASNADVPSDVLSQRYDALLLDPNYIAATSRSTSDKSSVKERIRLAKAYLSE